MSDWKTLSSKVIHETQWIRLIEDKIETHTGKKLIYTYVQMVHPGVAIVAVDPDGNVLLQKSYRHTLKQTQWEIPAGHMEDDETPLATAQRELIEETNLVSDQWINLGTIELAAGIGDVKMHLFAALHAQPSIDSGHDEDELISEQAFIGTDELKRRLRACEISSASSLIGLYRYLDTIDVKETT